MGQAFTLEAQVERNGEATSVYDGQVIVVTAQDESGSLVKVGNSLYNLRDQVTFRVSNYQGIQHGFLCSLVVGQDASLNGETVEFTVEILGSGLTAIASAKLIFDPWYLEWEPGLNKLSNLCLHGSSLHVILADKKLYARGAGGVWSEVAGALNTSFGQAKQPCMFSFGGTLSVMAGTATPSIDIYELDGSSWSRVKQYLGDASGSYYGGQNGGFCVSGGKLLGVWWDNGWSRTRVIQHPWPSALLGNNAWVADAGQYGKAWEEPGNNAYQNSGATRLAGYGTPAFTGNLPSAWTASQVARFSLGGTEYVWIGGRGTALRRKLASASAWTTTAYALPDSWLPQSCYAFGGRLYITGYKLVDGKTQAAIFSWDGEDFVLEREFIEEGSNWSIWWMEGDAESLSAVLVRDSVATLWRRRA